MTVQNFFIILICNRCRFVIFDYIRLKDKYNVSAITTAALALLIELPQGQELSLQGKIFEIIIF